MHWLLLALMLAGCSVVIDDAPLDTKETAEMATTLPPTSCRVVLIGGTWAITRTGGEAWWRPTSPFAKRMRERGVPLLAHRAFVWTTDLEGVWPSRKRRTWAVAGENLATYIQAYAREGERVCVIAHSHGGQVVAYAARFGAKFDTVVTVATPVRRDMAQVYDYLKRYARRWVHVYSDWSDRWQVFGEFFDGVFGVRRQMPLAHENVERDGFGHSELLDPDHLAGLILRK